ncbi:hypothetical protein BDE02_19G003600 [Populus trichocarpa]|nr:hypothetical protein BDE02_19G003600 [Populus trichocarpa]
MSNNAVRLIKSETESGNFSINVSSTPLKLPAIVIIPKGKPAHSLATSIAIRSTSGENAMSCPSFSMNKVQASLLESGFTLILCWLPIR